MTQDPQQRGDFPGVARDGNVGVVVLGEDVVESALRADVLIDRGFCAEGLPESVGFGEIGLEEVGGESGVDVGFGATAVARVAADAFTEEFFDGGNEWVGAGKVEASEGDVGGGEAAGQGAGVVALWCGDLLHVDLGGPKVMCDAGLRGAGRGNLRIGPCCGVIAVAEGPVAVPGRGAVVAFGSVVVSFAVAAHVEELIFDVVRGVALELGYLTLEALPLGQPVVRVGRVRAIQEPKVGSCVVKGRGVGGRIILCEEAGNGAVADVGGGDLPAVSMAEEQGGPGQQSGDVAEEHFGCISVSGGSRYVQTFSHCAFLSLLYSPHGGDCSPYT